MWIRTKDGKWYICELRGVVFVSWVNERDRGHAAIFPEKDIDEWVKILGRMTGEDLEAVSPW